jgi:hypothetical protein
LAYPNCFSDKNPYISRVSGVFCTTKAYSL